MALPRRGLAFVLACFVLLPARARSAPPRGGPAGAGIYIVMHASGTSYDFALMHIQPGSVAVHVGQTVAAGEQIAKVGHTGDAQGPHLHFEVWVGPWQTGGHPIDPLPLLQSW